MGGAIMFCPESEDEGENEESDRALFLRGEDEEPELPAPLHEAYRTGSVSPASRKPFKRNWQESQTPQARPSAVGS